jgi:hypothetical protein
MFEGAAKLSVSVPSDLARSVRRVPAPVLAEVCRGGRLDAPVQRVLTDRGLVVVDLTSRIAQRAGGLLCRARMSSTHAVDAFVVATAVEFGSALIATGVPSDIGRLAADFQQLSIFAI